MLINSYVSIGQIVVVVAVLSSTVVLLSMVVVTVEAYTVVVVLPVVKVTVLVLVTVVVVSAPAYVTSGGPKPTSRRTWLLAVAQVSQNAATVVTVDSHGHTMIV